MPKPGQIICRCNKVKKACTSPDAGITKYKLINCQGKLSEIPWIHVLDLPALNSILGSRKVRVYASTTLGISVFG